MKAILNLHVKSTPNGNVLKWVGTTRNNSHYTLLRSTNEIDFSTIHTIDLKASTSEVYEYLDKAVSEQTTFYQVLYAEGEEVKQKSEVVAVEHAATFSLRNFLIRVAIFAVLVVLVMMGLRSLTAKGPVVAKKYVPETIPQAKVATVKYRNHSTKIEALGQVISTQPIDIISEVAGKILKGDVVLRKANTFQEGTVLFSIENEEAILNLKSQRANYANNIATMLADIKLDFSEQYDKWNNYFQSIDINRSLPPLPATTTQRERTFIATRNLTGTFYAIKSQEERLKKYIVTAPFGGMISQVYTDAGSVANPGTRVVRIMRTNQMELELPVRKEDIQYVRVGLTVKVFNEDRSKSTTGRIARISNTVDPATQSIPVYISLQSKRGFKLYEGLYLYAELSGRTISKAMEISRKALIDKNQVFVMNADSTLTQKAVTIHKVNTETVLFSGLKVGEKVVNSNLLGISEGAKIMPID